MLAELILTLNDNANGYGFWTSSLFQGILMEQIDKNYGALLHQDGWKPYSQFIEKGTPVKWHVCTLTKEAYESILLPLESDDFKSFNIKQKDIEISIVEKSFRVKPKRELMEEMYSEKANRFIDIKTLTPVSFKKDNSYQNMPDTRLFFQSLMNKYSAASENMDMFDTETLDALCENSRITSYRLSSSYFPLEGVKIPAFSGELSIRMSGPETLVGYANLLVKFGEFSGVGIKSAMGMGAIRRQEDKRNKNDRSKH